jgi:Protein of unknown function (DUF3016)
MKSLLRTIATAILLLLAAPPGATAKSEPLPDRISVTWSPTEQLTEVKNNQIARGWLRPKDWMDALGKEFRRRADRILPAGQKLDIHVDDVKLAGAFEPWRRASMADVRIMKDIYPPMMKLHYKLVAADGSAIRAGDATLRDSSYLQRAIGNTTDPLRYDKRMIDEWLRKEFGAKRAGG